MKSFGSGHGGRNECNQRRIHLPMVVTHHAIEAGDRGFGRQLKSEIIQSLLVGCEMLMVNKTLSLQITTTL